MRFCKSLDYKKIQNSMIIVNLNFCRIRPQIRQKKRAYCGQKGVKEMLDRIALILVIIGALNWGSIGIFNFDIVGAIFGGQGSIIARIIFTIVGIAGLWAIGLFFKERNALENR